MKRRHVGGVLAALASVGALSDLSPLNATMKYLKRDVGKEAKSSLLYLSTRLWRFFGVAEATLQRSTSGYLLDDICLADLSVFPVVQHHLASLRASERFSALCDWADEIAERPGVRRAFGQLVDAKAERATETLQSNAVHLPAHPTTREAASS